MDNINNFGISKSPLDGLNETELLLVLGDPDVDEAVKIGARAKLDSMNMENKIMDVNPLGHGNSQVQSKTLTKALPQFKNNRADDVGYVNIILLMLVTWVTCLLGMFYVYSNIMG